MDGAELGEKPAMPFLPTPLGSLPPPIPQPFNNVVGGNSRAFSGFSARSDITVLTGYYEVRVARTVKCPLKHCERCTYRQQAFYISL